MYDNWVYIEITESRHMPLGYFQNETMTEFLTWSLKNSGMNSKQFLYRKETILKMNKFEIQNKNKVE